MLYVIIFMLEQYSYRLHWLDIKTPSKIILRNHQGRLELDLQVVSYIYFLKFKPSTVFNDILKFNSDGRFLFHSH